QEDQRRVAVRPRPTPRGATARRARSATPPRADRRDLGAVRQLRPPVPLGVNPTVDALRATFGSAIGRGLESCGDTIVRSEERRVGKECRCGWWPYGEEKKEEQDL